MLSYKDTKRPTDASERPSGVRSYSTIMHGCMHAAIMLYSSGKGLSFMATGLVMLDSNGEGFRVYGFGFSLAVQRRQMV